MLVVQVIREQQLTSTGSNDNSTRTSGSSARVTHSNSKDKEVRNSIGRGQTGSSALRMENIKKNLTNAFSAGLGKGGRIASWAVAIGAVVRRA